MTERKIEAIDTPVDTTGWIPEENAVLDLTAARFATEDEKGRDDEEKLYRDFVARLEAEGALATDAGGKTAPSGGDDEEAAYRAFVEQSGMADFTGRRAEGEPQNADMSGSASEAGDRAPEGAVGGFFGVEDLLRIAAEDGADMSELGGKPNDDALPREVREAEELNDALLRQAQAEHFGPDEADGASDGEMWDAYRKTVGEDR